MEPAGLVIQPAAVEDIEGIMLVERHCFGRAWTRQQYLDGMIRAAASAAYVARVLGDVVGFGSITCVGPEGYIPTLGVLSAYRRHGLGSRLLTALLADARGRGVESVVLEVRQRNIAARGLYERHGFAVIGTRPGYYQEPPDDGLVMKRVMVGVEVSGRR